MTQDAIVELADAWIRYWQAPEDSVERGDFDLAMRFHDIEHHQPEILWAMILSTTRAINRPTFNKSFRLDRLRICSRCMGRDLSASSSRKHSATHPSPNSSVVSGRTGCPMRCGSEFRQCGIGVDGTEPLNSFLQNIDYEKTYSSLSGCSAIFFSPAAFFSL